MKTLRFASRNPLVDRPAAVAAAVSWLLLAAFLWGASSAQATTKTFSFTNGEQTFVVPSGVSLVHVLVVGGSGGEGGVEGGAAAEVTGDLSVTPGDVLYVEVAGIGEDSGEGGEGGFNGGAAGGSASGGRGGGSDIRLLPLSSGLISDTRLVVAGGAGGGGGNGEDFGGNGGDAGSAGGFSSSWEGGGAGTESEGGEGGEGCTQFGESGQLGQGGVGGFGESGNNGGGGGGGGFYGGGGGGPGCVSGGGGGGGGSSLVPLGGELETASLLASPEIQISYTPPPSIKIVSPGNGATYTQGQSILRLTPARPKKGRAGLLLRSGRERRGARHREPRATHLHRPGRGHRRR